MKEEHAIRPIMVDATAPPAHQGCFNCRFYKEPFSYAGRYCCRYPEPYAVAKSEYWCGEWKWDGKEQAK